MSQDGLTISEISVEEFRDFARRYATSPEIGPIKTDLDNLSDPALGTERVLLGLRGCDRLCAAACLLVIQSKLNRDQQVVKLDSVVVDHALRRRGLANLLLTQSFLDLVVSGTRNICRIYAHSVHPATVRLLRRLTFNDPQVTGAPISDLSVDDESRAHFIQTCEDQIRRHVEQLRLQCEFCRKRDKRARPWCLPRGEKPSF
jgi:hypothetical protein